MAIRLGSIGIGAVLLAAVAGGGCGSDGDGGSGGGQAMGGSGGSSQGGGAGLPSRLPESEAECDSATGSDGCFFDACCAELVACAENPACATTFGCYRSCPLDDSDCFPSCAGSALGEAGEEFSAALSCSLVAGIPCGGGTGGTGGTGGSGGEGGAGATGGTSGSAGNDAGPLGTATDELGWNLAVSDDPLTAELTPDVDRAVSEEVTLEGGTITATAEDGTVFELTIPEGALYGPTVITLTPLLSFEVASLEGPAHGVQIEPDGLPLMASPTLEITLPEDVGWTVDQQLPLATTGEDNVVSLALLEPESEPLRLALSHFSSYAVLFAEKGVDSKLSQADIRNRFGGAAEERLQSAAAERLGKARMKALLGIGDDLGWTDGMEDLFAEFEKNVLEPRIARAGDSCAAGKLAMTTLIGVERQKALLGQEGLPGRSFADLIPIVAKVCMREEYEICRDEHIITRILPAFLGIVRQAELLGFTQKIDDVSVPPPFVLEVEQYAKDCLQFELQFDSNVLYSDADDTLTMRETVTARVPFGLQATIAVLPEEGLPPGAARSGALIGGGPSEPLESTSYSVQTNAACRTIDAENPAHGEFFVTYMGFTPGENSPQTPGGSAQITDIGLSIAISPNLSAYDFTQREERETGCGAATSTSNEVLSWSSTLGSFFLTEIATGDDGAWVADWEPVNSDIVATKDMDLNESDGSYTSRGPVNLIVFHTPK